MFIITFIIFIIIGMLITFRAYKLAVLFGPVSMAACFGYRYWIGGEELLVVIADVYYYFALLPIGLFAANKLESN